MRRASYCSVNHASHPQATREEEPVGNVSLSKRRVVGLIAWGAAGILTACSDSANTANTSTVPSSVPVASAATIASATTAEQARATPPTEPVAVAPPTTMPTVSTTPVTLAPVPDQRASIGYQHPQLGPVTITIAYPEPADGDLIVPTVQATVNATGQSVFSWTATDGYLTFDFAGAAMNPRITNPVDKLGHVFFEWDPGRYPGVSYLVPTPEGFDSNATLGDSWDHGHYVAMLVDENGDGTYEINQGFQVCEPNCADGYFYSYPWAWDGNAYTGPDADPGRDDAVPPGDLSQLEPAKAAFNEYLLAVGARDYQRAWDMLEPGYQERYGGYDTFTAFWDTVDSVGIERLDASWGFGFTNLDGTLWFQLKNGVRQTEDVYVSMSYGDPPKIANYVSYGANG